MKFKKIKTFLLTVLFLMFGITISKAGYSASNPTVKSGENINITVSSSVALDAYNIDLQSYKGLTFKSCSKSADGAMVNVNGGSIGYMNMSGNTKTLGTYTFKAPNVTEKKTYEVLFSINQGEATVKAKVTVNPNNTGSSNTGTGSSNSNSSNTSTKTESAKVSSCTVNGVKIKESLKVTNKESVSVVIKTSNGEDATIYNSLTKKSYTAKSGKSVSVQVAEGTNTLTISLSNGYKTTRKIYSQKEEEVKPNTIEEEDKKEEVKLILKTLKIEGYDIVPAFSPEVYEYTVNILEENNDITKLNIEAIGDKDNFTVEIKGNEELSDGENLITITVKSPDSEKVATYKIKVIKEAKTVIASTNVIEETDDEIDTANNKSPNILTIGVIVFTALVAIAGIVFAVVEYKYGKNNKDEKLGDIPYPNIGFEKTDMEENNENILKQEAIEETDSVNDEEKDDNFIEDIYKQKSDGLNIDSEIDKPKKRGKHF